MSERRFTFLYSIGLLMVATLLTFIVIRVINGRFTESLADRAAEEIGKYTAQVYTDGEDFFVKSLSGNSGDEDLLKAGLLKYARDGYYIKVTDSAVKDYREAAEASGNFHYSDRGLKMVKINQIIESSIEEFMRVIRVLVVYEGDGAIDNFKVDRVGSN